MINNSRYFIGFILGIAVGSAIVWKITKTKYEHIAQEEIDSVKEVFSKREESRSAADQAKDKPDISEYASKISNEGYADHGKSDKLSSTFFNIYNEFPKDDIYIISPEEYGNNEDYETESLTYYSDDILTDEEDHVISDYQNIVGEDYAEHFGEYEDDSVFVRNNLLKCDYEILADTRNYHDVIGKKPYIDAEDE